MKFGIEIDRTVYSSWEIAVYDEYFRHRGFNGCFDEFWHDYFWELSKDAIRNAELISVYYTKFVPKKSVVSMLRHLSKENEIYYITNRPDELRFTTLTYLKRYNFPHVNNLIMEEDKSLSVRVNEIDIFIDSDIDVVDSVSNSLSSDCYYVNSLERGGLNLPQTLELINTKYNL